MGVAPFTARLEPGSSAVTIALSGELDMSTVPILEEHLVRVEADEVTTIVVDLHDVTFLDSSALHALFAARQRADANRHRLVLARANSFTRRMFELVGIQSLLDDQGVVDGLGA